MKPRKAAVVFIFITVTLDMLALGLIAPVLPKLVLNFLGGDASSAAKMVRNFRNGLCADAVLLFTGSGCFVRSIRASADHPRFRILGSDSIMLSWRCAHSSAGSLLDESFPGSRPRAFPPAMAYISDVVAPEKRAGAFGMIGAAFGVGFVLGPALGGLLGNPIRGCPFGSRAA